MPNSAYLSQKSQEIVYISEKGVEKCITQSEVSRNSVYLGHLFRNKFILIRYISQGRTTHCLLVALTLHILWLCQSSIFSTASSAIYHVDKILKVFAAMYSICITFKMLSSPNMQEVLYRFYSTYALAWLIKQKAGSKQL